MEETHIVSAASLSAFVNRVFVCAGVPAEQAANATSVLLWANLHGVDTHGVRLLKKEYVDPLLAGDIKQVPNFQIEHESIIGVRANGDNGLGLAAGCWAMRYAIAKAQTSGAAFLTMHSSNHIGPAGYFSMLATDHDMIGLSMTGSFLPDHAEVGLLPTFGTAPMLSTNPLSFAFPAANEPPFVLDMATTIVPYNRIGMRKEAGQSIPLGWGLDKHGQPTTDPAALRFLLPLGGSREQGGHKGFGLALMVEIMAAVLSGGFTAPASTPTGNGEAETYQKHAAHFFGAIRIECFREPGAFKQDMDALIQAIHAAPVEAGQEQIFVPGEIEQRTRAQRIRTGIPLPAYVWSELRTLSTQFEIAMP